MPTQSHKWPDADPSALHRALVFTAGSIVGFAVGYAAGLLSGVIIA